MILKDIWMDVKAVQERDPAARSALEVLLLYQGVHALIWHRFAHWFYKHHMFFIARLISQIAQLFYPDRDSSRRTAGAWHFN